MSFNINDGGELTVSNPCGSVNVHATDYGLTVTTGIVQGGGDSTLVITLSWNSATELWEPDSTYEEIASAYSSQSEVVCMADDGSPVWWLFEDDVFQYTVLAMRDDGDDHAYFETLFYSMDADGVEYGGSHPYRDTESSTGTAAEMASGSSFFNAEGYVVGTATRRTSSDLNVSGATVTAPAGYYASAASKNVTSGTAGTPTATKGTVSNHAVSVTPSVTNTAGYITGGTKTGTAVSVAASDLVSGDLSITSSGTKDVTNYASATVASGGATASATKGSVSNHSVSVTPSVTRTAGYVTAGTASGTAVTVSASELVSGSLSISANNTYDVTNYASAVVNVSGGASNFVTGTFTTGSSTGTAATFSTGYTGSGYPIALMIWIDGGPYNNGTGGNTTWYNSVQRYAIGFFSLVKSQTTTTPTYATSGAANYGTVTVIYKNSTSQATTYSRTSSMTANSYTSSSTNANATNTTAVRFKGDGKTVTYFVASTSYGLLASTKYAYCVLYSS